MPRSLTGEGTEVSCHWVTTQKHPASGGSWEASIEISGKRYPGESKELAKIEQ